MTGLGVGEDEALAVDADIQRRHTDDVDIEDLVARLDLMLLPDVLLDVLPRILECRLREEDLGFHRFETAAHCITSSSLRFSGIGLWVAFAATISQGNSISPASSSACSPKMSA